MSPASLTVELREVQWPLHEPFVIARGTQNEMRGLELRLVDSLGRVGQAESQGVDYRGESPATLAAQLEALRDRLHEGLQPQDIQDWLPPGGARHLLDAALWDLQAKRTGVPIWQHLGLPRWSPVHTAVTVGIGDDGALRRKLHALAAYPIIKLKLDKTHHGEVVRLARHLRPDARLTVDCNGGFDRDLLERCLPDFQSCGVELIEQPLPPGQDAELEGLHSPIPLAADESCDNADDVPRLVGRYQVANIKLEKTGGLTAALALIAAARRAGLKAMVGTMGGSSLAMAPSFALAGMCRWVDLDTPLLLSRDHPAPMRYERGLLYPPPTALWG